jgi:hypothetical protein
MVHQLFLIPQPTFYLLDPEIPKALVFIYSALSELFKLQHLFHTVILRISRLNSAAIVEQLEDVFRLES